MVSRSRLCLISLPMDFLSLLFQTILLRPYVFIFLAAALFAGHRFMGWKRLGLLFGITWFTAFVAEFSSTRIGIPFGSYFYTGSTYGQELYVFNIPFMDSLSFTFLLFASYSVCLWFFLPWEVGGGSRSAGFFLPPVTSWTVVILTAFFLMYIDIVIDPVALRGDRWFLGKIYGYAEKGIYFGIPLTNFAGWMVVGLIAMTGYRLMEQHVGPEALRSGWCYPGDLLWGCGLYLGVLVFNLAVTFWIGEMLLGMVGCFIFLPILALAVLKWACRTTCGSV